MTTVDHVEMLLQILVNLTKYGLSDESLEEDAKNSFLSKVKTDSLWHQIVDKCLDDNDKINLKFNQMIAKYLDLALLVLNVTQDTIEDMKGSKAFEVMNSFP